MSRDDATTITFRLLIVSPIDVPQLRLDCRCATNQRESMYHDYDQIVVMPQLNIIRPTPHSVLGTLIISLFVIKNYPINYAVVSQKGVIVP